MDIGGQCDGLRCDMAMLMTNEVFARTWGERAGPVPASEYWPALIARVKRAHPDLLFIAEAYWDMEWTLQQQGFDHCYDKRLYDRLAHEPAEAVRGHLQADAALPGAADPLHREPRRAARGRDVRPGAGARGRGRRLDAAGRAAVPRRPARGRRAHIPVFLGRGPDEPPDEDLRAFYERLLRAVADSDLRDGDWRLCDVSGWPDNDSHRRLVAWCWSTRRVRHLVVVNLGDAPAQAPCAPALGRPRAAATGSWPTGSTAERSSAPATSSRARACTSGLDPWASYFLRVSPV